MSSEYSGNPATYPATITLPSDGDADAAATFTNGLSDLADRSAYSRGQSDLIGLTNWRTVSSVITGSVRGGCYGNVSRIWTVVGGTDQAAQSLDDGQTWGAAATGMASTLTPFDVATDNNIQIAVTNSATAYKRTGTGNWSTITMPGSPTAVNRIKCIPSGTHWLASGKTAGPQPYFATSTDGTTFTSRTAPAGMNGFEIGSLAMNPSGVAVACAYGARTKVSYSTDYGVTWQDCTTTLTSNTYQVCWSVSLSLFFITGNSGPTYSSPNGNTWTQVATSSGSSGSVNADSKVIEAQGMALIVINTTVSPSQRISLDGGVTWFGNDGGSGQLFTDANTGKVLQGGNGTVTCGTRTLRQP